jgi:hypothetical protein
MWKGKFEEKLDQKHYLMGRLEWFKRLRLIFREITGKDEDYETEDVSLSDLIDCIENNIDNFDLVPGNMFDGKGSNIGFSPLEVIDALTRFEGEFL